MLSIIKALFKSIHHELTRPMTEEERKRMQDAYYYHGPWY